MFITPFAPEATPQPTQTSASDLLQRKDTTAWEDLSTCGWYSGTSSRPYVCVSPLTCSTDTGSVVGCVSEGMAQLYTSCLGYRDVRLGRCSSAGPKTGCCEDEALPDCGTFIWTGSPTRYMFKCFTETTTISMLDEPQFVVDAAKASAPEAFARSTSSPSLGLTVIPVPHTSTSSGATGTDTQESSTSSSLVLTVIPVPHRSSSKTTSTGPESPSPTILASSLISTTPISSSSAPADSPSTAITFPASNTGAPPGLSTATKAGIGAGVGVGVMVILLLAIFSPSFLKKSRKRKQAQGENSIAPALQQQEGGAPSEACHGKAELEDPRYLLGQLQSGGYQGRAELDAAADAAAAAASGSYGVCDQCGSGTGFRNGGGGTAVVDGGSRPAEAVELDGSPVLIPDAMTMILGNEGGLRQASLPPCTALGMDNTTETDA
ncbi:hypothetical protein VM1G_06659 [Cytospora mali]|uniref:Uncharacterized protein n=1 Tax=Cytospora mali TaxID=578113 RepID=A0A194W5A4_CYTMA|nr:hypothetical protein VM1G_06659 [Valsa mali]